MFLGAINCIIDALCNWNQNTTANWIFGGIESYSGISDNGKNQIIWSNSFGSGTGGETYVDANLDICDDFVLIDDVDMIIFNPNFTSGTTGITYTGNYDCNVPPADTQFDFYTTVLHELGHVHLLDHVASRSKVMYPYHLPGEKRDILHTDDINGGMNVVQHSVNDWSLGCDYPIFQPQINCTNNSNEAIKIGISIYPNPVSSSSPLVIKGRFESGDAIIEVINLSGNIVSQIQVDIIDEVVQIDLNTSIPPGAYVVKVNSTNHYWLGKFIKI